MQINVTGFTEEQAAELEAAALFFSKALGLGRIGYQLDIERNKKLDNEGECADEDGVKNPRWFTITLRGKRGDDPLTRTLAHEMVHVKQYIRNELGKEMTVSKGKGFSIATKWKGEYWTPAQHEDEYFDSPWEIEAYGREVGLYHKWTLHREEEKKVCDEPQHQLELG